MINNVEFSKRLKKIMEYYDLSAAAFADKIEVGRSSISHIISGRNKPSLDFIMKVLQSFPEINLYWLMNGKGKFLSNTDYREKPSTENKDSEGPSPSPTKKSTQKLTIDSLASPSSHKTIDKVIIFYSDGSFEAFKN